MFPDGSRKRALDWVALSLAFTAVVATEPAVADSGLPPPGWNDRNEAAAPFTVVELESANPARGDWIRISGTGLENARFVQFTNHVEARTATWTRIASDGRLEALVPNDLPEGGWGVRVESRSYPSRVIEFMGRTIETMHTYHAYAGCIWAGDGVDAPCQGWSYDWPHDAAVDSFGPSHVGPGDDVAFEGTDLRSVTLIMLWNATDGVPLDFASVSDSQYVARIPSHVASGAYSLQVSTAHAGDSWTGCLFVADEDSPPHAPCYAPHPYEAPPARRLIAGTEPAATDPPPTTQPSAAGPSGPAGNTTGPDEDPAFASTSTDPGPNVDVTAVEATEPMSGPGIADAGSPRSTWTGLLILAASAIASGWAALGRLPRWMIALAVVPLFSRVARSRLLDHPVRAELLDLITAQPGIHFNDLVRAAGRSRGATAHHLRILRLARLVRCHASGGRLCYFRADAGAESHIAALAVLRSAPTRLVYATISTRAPGSLNDLAVAAGIAPSAAHAHVQRLREAGLVETHRVGRSVQVNLVDP